MNLEIPDGWWVEDSPACEQLKQELVFMGFKSADLAWQRLKFCYEFCADKAPFLDFLPMLLSTLTEAATTDGSLLNFERYVQRLSYPQETFTFLARNPRAVEILVKLFVGSQFLTEILLKTPEYLEKLTHYNRLAEFKSREEFKHELMQSALTFPELQDQLDSVRISHQWEILRISASDAFHLMDLKTVTLQLSLLADSIVQSCLELLAREMNLDYQDFAVIAFGKLGGEEINYSSDIDLVFLAKDQASQYWSLGQKLIRALMESTTQGFMYRVDMRLRPWGKSGALVSSYDSYLDYIQKHAQLWEKQALLKARTIAGNHELGNKFLQAVASHIYDADIDQQRHNIRQMKLQIEQGLKKKGSLWGEVKAGIGSIRDVEFVVQFLQMSYGQDLPRIRTFNTLDGLVRLADASLIRADEYRQLSNGYIFLRHVEHMLQLMHNKQIHTLPTDERELEYLARRLDYPNATVFLNFYEQHCASIRKVYEKYLHEIDAAPARVESLSTLPLLNRLSPQDTQQRDAFSPDELAIIQNYINNNSHDTPFMIQTKSHQDGLELLIVGKNVTRKLPVICGLLFWNGFNIESGKIETLIGPFTPQLHKRGKDHYRKISSSLDETNAFFLAQFRLSPTIEKLNFEWKAYERELIELDYLFTQGRADEAYGELARRVGASFRSHATAEMQLLPVNIKIDNQLDAKTTVLDISGEDTPGFLYELANGLSLLDLEIQKVVIQSIGSQVADTFFITDKQQRKILDEHKLHEIRAIMVLIKHFSHLLPKSSNPEAALLHFREFLIQLLQADHWLEKLSSIEQPEVLDVLARLLGGSNFLWEDFLRIQHNNLLPIVTNVKGLAHKHTKTKMKHELTRLLQGGTSYTENIRILNEFKDREMLRIDLRHILGYETTFGQFSQELTDMTEIVVNAALALCLENMVTTYGEPLTSNHKTCHWAMAALGKFGGKELGFASDIELMFIYESQGETSGPKKISNAEFFHKLLEQFQQVIIAKRQGIFEIDFRLRPYGRAGNIAVSLDSFTKYFSPTGPAWPYERQALVKLRTFAGHRNLCKTIEKLRDEMVYTGEPFDVNAMRGMRETQINQLVKVGTLNAKLSPGGLVDAEYLVQGLQKTYGHKHPELRTTNTREALKALENTGIISAEERVSLRDAYRFLRRLIDALRMVRGDARDLAVPETETNEFSFLAHRLGYVDNPEQLQLDIEHQMQVVRDHTKILDRISTTPA